MPDRRRPQLDRVYAAAVVPHDDDDPIAFLFRPNQELAGRGFAAPNSFAGRLDAVIDRVAEQVNQRLGNLLDDLLVELRFAAPDRQDHFLVEGSRQVAHGAWKRIEHRGERQHGQLDHALPELLGDQVQADPVVTEVRQELAHLPADGAERVGVLAKLRGNAVGRGAGLQPRFPHAIFQMAQRHLESA